MPSDDTALTIEVDEHKTRKDDPTVKEELPSPRARPPVHPNMSSDQPLKSSMHSSSNSTGGNSKRTARMTNRTLSVSSADSLTSSFSDLDDDQDDSCTVRNRVQVNSQGFSDFCVRKISRAEFGRREIEIAEQEMPGRLTFKFESSFFISLFSFYFC